MKWKGRIILILIILFYLLFRPGVHYERIDIVGSTSVQPVAEKLAVEYMKKHPNVKINVQGGGSSVGITQTQQGTADIGTSSRELKEDEKKGLKTYLIGKDGIVVIVNKQNNIQGLTTEQLRDIFSGKIRNWKEVRDPDAEIHVIVREEGSGTRKAFEEIVMKDAKIRNDAIVEGSTEAVKQDPNAMGFISLANLDNTVKALKIDGVTPSVSTVADGSYKLQRPFLFLTKGEPTGVVKNFIDWVLSPEGQTIVKSEKVVPAKQ